MKALKLAFNKYHFLLLPPIIISFAADYKSNGLDNLNLFLLFLLNVVCMLSSAILFKKIYSVKKYAPLKIILLESKIDTKDPELKPLELAMFMSGFLMLSIFLGLYLSVKTNFELFTTGLLSVLVAIIAFLPKLNLFNRNLSSVLIGLSLGGGVYYASSQISGASFDLESIFYFWVCSVIGFIISSIEDLQRINTDPNENKKTLAGTFGLKRGKQIVVFSFVALFISQIIAIIYTMNVWQFIPFFSATLAASISLKMYSRYGSELGEVVYMGFIFYYFHVILILVNILSK